MKKELIRATVNREHGMKRERRLSSRRALALVCSIAVLFSSLYISMSPVLADKLICGLKEHTHSADCYEEILVCGQEERDPEIVVHREFSGDFSWHTHSDSCRNEAGEIVCGQQEGYYHLHNEWCLDENGNVICGLDEIAPHSHDASCYAEDGTLICRKDDVPVLTCSEGNISEWEEVIDEGHTHTDDCYGLADTPSCGMKEHTHTADCYEPEKKEEKEPEKKEEKEPEKKEEKESEKKESEKNKDQEQEKKDPEKKGEEESEKKDEKDPEKKDSDQTEGKEQGKTEESGENGKTDDPSETDPNATKSDGEKKDGETPEGEGNPDGTPEGQTGGEQNGTGNPDGTGDGTNENPEGTGEGTDGNPEGTGEGTNENPEGTGEGTDGNPEGTGEGTDGNPEGTEGNPEGTGEGTDGNPEGTGEGTDGNPEGTGEGTDGNPEGTGDGTENANPDGTEGDPALNGETEGAEGKEGLEGTEGKEGTEGAEGAEGTEPGTNATDAEGNMIGEDGQVEGEEGLMGEEGENPEGAEEQEPAEPVNYIVGPLVFPGADYTVTANFGVEALFPEGTTLQVREILPGDAEYEQLAAQAESAVVDDEETSVNMMRFFDITFMTEKGEIEPQAPVNIQITYNEVIPDTVDDMVYTLHFAEEGQAPEVLETKTKSVDAAAQVEEAVDTVEFQSGSFSTFVVVSVRQKTVPPPEQTIVLTEASFQITWYDQKIDNEQATAWPVTVENKPETINITLQKSSGEDAEPNSLQYTVAGSGAGTLIKIDGREPSDTERGIYTCSCSSPGETPSIYNVTVSGLVDGTEYTITQNNTVSGYNSPEYEGNIMIKNYGKTFDALIDKKWNDGQASHTETVVVILTGTADASYKKEYMRTLPGEYGYSDEIIDLPYRGTGKIVTYSLTETLPGSLSTDYGYSVTETPTEGGVLYTIKNSRLKFSIQGNVIWDLQAEHTLPTSLDLQLKRKKGQSGTWEQVGEIQTVTADSWAYKWENLDQFVDASKFPAEEYIYQLEATNLPEEYTPAVGTEGNQYHLKFVYEVVDVKVTTQWNDDGDRDGKRPGTSDYAPYLKLYIGDIEVKGATPTVTDNHDNTYTVSFGIKDKKKSGNPIDYKIRENKVPGYNTTSTSKYRIVNVGGTFLNTYRPAQTLITVIKRWNDRLDRDGLRADVVTRIELLKTVDGNTDIADSVTVQTADLVWTKVWSGLPVNEGGKPISYSVREIMINANGYTTDAEEPLRVLNGGKVTITDTHIPAPVVPPSRSSTTNRTGTTGTSTGSSSGSSGGSSGGGYYGGGYSSGTKSSIRNVKVFYWLRKQGGEPAAKTASVNHREGEAFAIYSPQIPGYQTNMTLVSGKMGVRDDVYHVIYKPMDYVLTIEFLDEKGETLAKAVTLQKMHVGDEYSVPVPEIAGYRAGLTAVQGTFTGNQRIRVVYIPEGYGYTVIEDYKIPRSFGAMPVNVGECWE